MSYLNPYEEARKRREALTPFSDPALSPYESQSSQQNMAEPPVLGKMSSALGVVGLGLQGVGTAYDIYNENWGQGAKDRKRQQKMEDEQFALMRAKMLQELGQEKKKSEWNRRFTNAFIGGRAK